MEQFASLQTGLVITFIGMFVVMAFLVVMIYVMKLTSRIIIYLNKIFPEEIKEEKTTKKKQQKSDDTEIAIAIAAAISAQGNLEGAK